MIREIVWTILYFVVAAIISLVLSLTFAWFGDAASLLIVVLTLRLAYNAGTDEKWGWFGLKYLAYTVLLTLTVGVRVGLCAITTVSAGSGAIRFKAHFHTPLPEMARSVLGMETIA